jgi:hypothetical protein
LATQPSFRMLNFRLFLLIWCILSWVGYVPHIQPDRPGITKSALTSQLCRLLAFLWVLCGWSLAM